MCDASDLSSCDGQSGDNSGMLAVQVAELTAATAARGTQLYQLQDKLLQAQQVGA